jgi:hypothetical protein
MRKTLAILFLVLAAALLAVGGLTSRKVYDGDSDDFGMLLYSRVGDAALVVDATFGGVTRRGEKLFSTYDRTAERGKRLCPT